MRWAEIAESILPLRRFNDRWRDAPAECILFGHGSGPEGEAVRVVLTPRMPRKSGADIWYIHSYDEGQGNATSVYKWLRRRYGELYGREVRSEAGREFHTRMKDRGIIADFSRD